MFLKKIILLTVMSSLILSVVYSEAQESSLKSHQLTGTVISLSKTHIQISYREKDVKYIRTFQITEETNIVGTPKSGALVTVTYTLKRVHKGLFKSIAVEVRVIKDSSSSDDSSPNR